MTLIIPEVLNVRKQRLLHNSILGDDGIRWIKCPGARFREIKISDAHYVPLFKITGWQNNGNDTRCYECLRLHTSYRTDVGNAQREKIFLSAGGCQWVEDGVRCIMRYPEHLRGNFALDHINPKLKQHNNEVDPKWIIGHMEEFHQRVVPNLQVLCNHHNLVKMSEEFGVGGTMHVDPWLEQYDEELIVPDINQLSLFDEDLLT